MWYAKEAQGLLPSNQLLDVNWTTEDITVPPWLVCGVSVGVTGRTALIQQNSSVSVTHIMVLRCRSMEQPSTSLLLRPMRHAVILEGNLKDGVCLLVWTQAVSHLMGLWNICLPLILQQFETHSVSLLLKVAPICCSYSVPCVQQYVTPTFHFAAHWVRFPLFRGLGNGKEAVYVWVPDYYLVACYSWNASENLAIGFFTEQPE